MVPSEELNSNMYKYSSSSIDSATEIKISGFALLSWYTAI